MAEPARRPVDRRKVPAHAASGAVFSLYIASVVGVAEWVHTHDHVAWVPAGFAALALSYRACDAALRVIRRWRFTMDPADAVDGALPPPAVETTYPSAETTAKHGKANGVN